VTVVGIWALPATGNKTGIAHSATLAQKDLTFTTRLRGFIEQQMARIIDDPGVRVWQRILPQRGDAYGHDSIATAPEE
jgi:hypothetical protein